MLRPTTPLIKNCVWHRRNTIAQLNGQYMSPTRLITSVSAANGLTSRGLYFIQLSLIKENAAHDSTRKHRPCTRSYRNRFYLSICADYCAYNRHLHGDDMTRIPPTGNTPRYEPEVERKRIANARKPTPLSDDRIPQLATTSTSSTRLLDEVV